MCKSGTLNNGRVDLEMPGDSVTLKAYLSMFREAGMRIFVSGGSGFVGGHICRELRAAGHEVRLLVHRRSVSPEAGIEQVEGDVAELGSFAQGLAGCDAVINLVGIIREFPGRGITFDRLHVAATRNMLAAARQNGIGRYLQMSALGARSGAASRYHQTKFQAEELVGNSGLDATIFRPSLIFGPKDAFVNMLAGYIRNFSAVPVVGDGSYRLQPIAATDVARCFALALAMPETIGKSYTLCGPDRLTYNDLVDTIGLVLGKKSVVKLRNPLALLRMITPLLQGFSFFPLTMDQITMLLEESICDGSWQETFHFAPTGFQEGIERYLR
jgi:uncharacterized protein YbjT (DUF2867 family)